MAFQSISVDNVTPLWIDLVQQGVISSAQFGFWLADLSNPIDVTGGELTLGGVDPTRFTGPLQYHPLISETYWMIAAESVTIGGRNLGAFQAVVDTGTSLMLFNTSTAKKINGAMGCFTVSVLNGECFFVGCPLLSQLPDLTYTLGGGGSYTLKGPELVKAVNVGGFDECLSVIIGMDLPGLPELIILGDIFLMKYYSNFDMTNKRVGFAPAVQPSH